MGRRHGESEDEYRQRKAEKKKLKAAEEAENAKLYFGFSNGAAATGGNPRVFLMRPTIVSHLPHRFRTRHLRRSVLFQIRIRTMTPT